jgi:hypothetical protein
VLGLPLQRDQLQLQPVVLVTGARDLHAHVGQRRGLRADHEQPAQGDDQDHDDCAEDLRRTK